MDTQKTANVPRDQNDTSNPPRRLTGKVGPARTDKWLALGLGVAAAVTAAAFSAPPRYSFRGRTVVITGGSRGLGLVLAREFAKEGAHIALLARTRNDLYRARSELVQRGARVIALPCDVRVPEQVADAMRTIVQNFGRIDVLINNAGIIQVGPLDHMTMADFQNAMATHCFGPLSTSLAVRPYMRAIGGGRIVNIASIGGKVALPHLLPYTASKFALVGLSDGLRAELRRDGIHVTTVCPGLMRTGSPRNAAFKGKHRAEYAWFTISDSLPVLSMKAERAARRIVEGCRDARDRIVLGVPAKLAVFMNEMLPGVVAEASAWVNRMLPDPDPALRTDDISGRRSSSPWAPSVLTHLTEVAAVKNNEIPHGDERPDVGRPGTAL